MKENRTTKTMRGPTIIFSTCPWLQNFSLKFLFFFFFSSGWGCLLVASQAKSIIHQHQKQPTMVKMFERATETFIVIKINKFGTLEWPSKGLNRADRVEKENEE
jgi:hypothetical protein